MKVIRDIAALAVASMGMVACSSSGDLSNRGSQKLAAGSQYAEAQRIQLSSLPDLPGCRGAVRRASTLEVKRNGAVSLREIADDAALYVAFVDATPVCVDDLQGIFRSGLATDDELARALSFEVNPLPLLHSSEFAKRDDDSVGEGTPLPAREVGGRPVSQDRENARNAMNSSSGDVSEGTPLPARTADGNSNGRSSESNNSGPQAPANPVHHGSERSSAESTGSDSNK